jgi:UDP-N-acetylmuramoylalanine--D-glutamate ligase
MSGAFAGERAVVIGFGASGRAAARALVADGADVLVSEAMPRDRVASLGDDPAVEVLAGGHRPEHLDGATMVVVSPGVPEHAPVIEWAGERGLPVWSELELGARVCSVPFVAITGTNGKTTTTELVASMMRAGGLRAVACGNVGFPFTDAARTDVDALAVEASSFQLRFTERFRPRVSVLLNVAPDHLDWHGSFPAYVEAKQRLFARQSGSDVHVGNASDPRARAISSTAPCEVRWFREGSPAPGEVGIENGAVISARDDRTELWRPGTVPRALLADGAAAAAAALAFGLSEEAASKALAGAQPGPHRGVVVATVGTVSFVDDSKATNPHAALASLEGRKDVVLIAGGVAKGIDLSPLREASPGLVAVVAIGEAAPKVAEVFDGAVPVVMAGSMTEAVEKAADRAPDRGTVLLAPACASFDMFRNYADRGDRFAEAARRVAGDRSGHAAPARARGGSHA